MAYLSTVKVIMAIIHVSLVELLCQKTIGWILAHEYLLPWAHGRLWPSLVMLGIKYPRFPRPRSQKHPDEATRCPGTSRAEERGGNG
jgi:hypothetical protein